MQRFLLAAAILGASLLAAQGRTLLAPPPLSCRAPCTHADCLHRSAGPERGALVTDGHLATPLSPAHGAPAPHTCANRTTPPASPRPPAAADASRMPRRMLRGVEDDVGPVVPGANILASNSYTK